MKTLQNIIASYCTALRLLGPFILIHFVTRLLAAAVIAPIAGLVMGAALAISGQHAITDQDIAGFLICQRK